MLDILIVTQFCICWKLCSIRICICNIMGNCISKKIKVSKWQCYRSQADNYKQLYIGNDVRLAFSICEYSVTEYLKVCFTNLLVGGVCLGSKCWLSAYEHCFLPEDQGSIPASSQLDINFLSVSLSVIVRNQDWPSKCITSHHK